MVYGWVFFHSCVVQQTIVVPHFANDEAQRTGKKKLLNNNNKTARTRVNEKGREHKKKKITIKSQSNKCIFTNEPNLKLHIENHSHKISFSVSFIA